MTLSVLKNDQGTSWIGLEGDRFSGGTLVRLPNGDVVVWVTTRRLGESGTWLLNFRDNGKQFWRWKPEGKGFFSVPPTFTIPGGYDPA